jgi:excisionase family DNA binding protein
MLSDNKILGTNEIAKAMGVTPKTVAKWCDQGYLRHTVLPGGNHRRIRLGDIKMFAKGHGLPFDYPPS